MHFVALVGGIGSASTAAAWLAAAACKGSDTRRRTGRQWKMKIQRRSPCLCPEGVAGAVCLDRETHWPFPVRSLANSLMLMQVIVSPDVRCAVKLKPVSASTDNCQRASLGEEGFIATAPTISLRQHRTEQGEWRRPWRPAWKAERETGVCGLDSAGSSLAQRAVRMGVRRAEQVRGLGVISIGKSNAPAFLSLACRPLPRLSACRCCAVLSGNGIP
ncbi:hypothetical protein NA57DRAFT_54654 [Rhizodiscina lignyota]|uniref:Uncharacterized protein n=1 Tax=Rhizodiscina lignyota TaxID=1504668 RepID=A0A9P4IJV9_9PEZI|nr:hypothetical protein NA57DRAFT_54654 [Rhizodiscina lignyota]